MYNALCAATGAIESVGHKRDAMDNAKNQMAMLVPEICVSSTEAQHKLTEINHKRMRYKLTH